MALNFIRKQEEESLSRCNRYQLASGYELTTCNCKHMRRLRLGEKHSICNPQKWLCEICYTTESVWACLSCPNVACGRYIQEHALLHYQESGHPIVIDVNELYVYCYKCDEYVLNDNNFSDIKVLRETLLAIRYQNFTGTTRSGHTLRSASITEKEDVEMRRKMQQEQLDRDDRMFTAIWHSRFIRQRKAFQRWLQYVYKCRKKHILDSSSSEDETEVFENKAEKLSKQLAVKHNDTVNSNKKLPLHSETHSNEHKTAQSVLSSLLQEVESIKDKDVSKHSFKKSPVKKILTNKDYPNTESKVITNETKKDSFKTGSATLPVTSCNSHKDLNKNQNTEKGDRIELTNDSENNNLNTSVINSPPKPSLDLKNNEAKSSNVVNKDKNDTTKSLPLEYNICSRPKRSTAARRYKEIFGKLYDYEPAVKQPKLQLTDNSDTSANFRRSERIKSLNVLKEKELKRQKKKERLKSRKTFNRKPKNVKHISQQTKKVSKKVSISHTNNPKVIKKKLPRKSYFSTVSNRTVTSLIPGVTGLRNLGNTCYLNSIIQVLGHLQKFRLCLLALQELEAVENSMPESKEWMPTMDSLKSVKKKDQTKHVASRRTTIELYEAQSRDENEFKMTRKSDRLANQQFQHVKDGKGHGKYYEDKWKNLSSIGSDPTSLCNELHDLYRVMWSGKWKMVSPYHFLQSGYSQQDAQEFLCELLDKIVNELEHNQMKRSVAENRLALRVLNVVHTVFEGQLTSQVRCLECKYVSTTVEPFWDLSLEFPERFHRIENKRPKSRKKSTNSQNTCDLLEMLEKFTAAEVLEGGKVYGCSQCNTVQYNVSSSLKKRTSRKISQLFTEAEKQMKITKLPQVLRFHLKRFKWAGRNHREKIAVHVNFPSELDMQPYCYHEDSTKNRPLYLYDLSAVVIHHGRGFGSGHYTAYCWNDDGNFWVHCNDSHLELCSIEDVMASQAYILFYTQRGSDPSLHLLSPPLTPVSMTPISSNINSPASKSDDENGSIIDSKTVNNTDTETQFNFSSINNSFDKIPEED